MFSLLFNVINGRSIILLICSIVLFCCSVLLFCCSVVLLFCCSVVLLFCRAIVLLFRRSIILRFYHAIILGSILHSPFAIHHSPSLLSFPIRFKLCDSRNWSNSSDQCITSILNCEIGGVFASPA